VTRPELVRPSPQTLLSLCNGVAGWRPTLARGFGPIPVRSHHPFTWLGACATPTVRGSSRVVARRVT